MPTIDGAWAFVPNPLPPKVDLGAVAPLLAEASMHLGELNGIGRSLANPYLLIRQFQRREAVASSAIEGTMTSLSDLFLFEAGADEKARLPDTREVYNYARALEYATERLNEIPLSLRLVREIHGILLEGVRKSRGGSQRPGEFREDQNWIGGDSARSARFVPPPPQRVMETLDAFEKFIHTNTETSIPPLIELAMLHYQFETIHPFPDGNGRVGRLLIPLILLSKKVLPQPLLYLSPFFERHYTDYIDKLYDISRRGAWLDWFTFFLTAVKEQCRDTIIRVRRLQDLQAKYRKTVQKARASALQLRLVDLAFEQPVFTIPGAQKVLGVTYRSAALNVNKLVDAGIVSDMSLEARPRYFLAHEVLEVIHSEIPSPRPT